MSRKADKDKSDYRTGPLFIEYLYISGMINERIFCFYITNEKS